MDTLTATANRALIKYAVQRAIFCPFSGAILDVSRAVLVQATGSRPFICTAAHWDTVKDSVAAGIQEAKDAGTIGQDVTLDVLDGRDYWTPAGRVRPAAKIAA